MERAARHPVTEVLRPCPLAIRPDTPVAEVFLKFSHPDVHQLLVIGEDKTVAGVITTRDVIEAITPGAGTLKSHQISGLDRLLKSTATTARDLVSSKPHTIPSTATLLEALREMEHASASSLIITDRTNMAIGCIDLAGILAFLGSPTEVQPHRAAQADGFPGEGRMV